MAYEPKSGSFSLFRNNKKTSDKQPDFRGDGLDLNGVEILVSAWEKKTKNGDTFYSVMMSKKSDFPKQQEQGKDLPF